MRLTQKNINRNSLSWILPLTVLLLISLLSSTSSAADYFVWGRVYCASTLTEDQEEPPNPLTGVPPEQIIGDAMFAVTPRNLVEVKIVRASNGSELGNYIVSHDGGYLVSFNTAASGDIEVRFIVEELATNETLLQSDPVVLSPWPASNILFLLVQSLYEVAGDREFAPAPPTGKYTAVFTRVGNIEEVDINDVNGLADDTSAYPDSPFGGTLNIFGAFSKDLYSMSPPVYYRIRIDKYGPPSPPVYMNDALVKTKYTVNFTTGTVDTKSETLGPWTVSGIPNCYLLTPIAVSNNEFWSFPDLVARWNTGSFNDKYKLTFEVVGLTNPADFVPIPDSTDLTLQIDNIAPVAQILPLDPTDYDTPRVYTPGAVPGEDLTSSLLGAFPGNYGGALVDPTCMILNLESPPDKYLAFKLTGYHANGYLRHWRFWFERNDKNNAILIGKRYDGASNSMVDYFTNPADPTGSVATLIHSNQENEHGFQEMYLYVSNGNLAPSSVSAPASCGYRFVIRAATRTTNGYYYLRWDCDQDIHYLQR